MRSLILAMFSVAPCPGERRHPWDALGLQALDGTDGYGADPVFERVFCEVGLPEAIQTDPRQHRRVVRWTAIPRRAWSSGASPPQRQGANGMIVGMT